MSETANPAKPGIGIEEMPGKPALAIGPAAQGGGNFGSFRLRLCRSAKATSTWNDLPHQTGNAATPRVTDNGDHAMSCCTSLGDTDASSLHSE